MKKMLFLLLGVFVSLAGMKRPAEFEKEEIKKQAVEQSVKKVPLPQLSEAVRSFIDNLHKQANLKNLPRDILAQILKDLAKAKVIGGTEEQKLYTAIANIRYFMYVFPQFFKDVQINGDIILELARRYAQGNGIKVAVALATSGAGEWLKAYVSDNAARNRALAAELVHAAENGQLGTVRFILQYVPQVVNVGYREDITALIAAALQNRIAIVERLLQVPGINVNAQTQNGSTALMIVSENGHTAVVQQLLQIPGINVNLQNPNGATALMYAAEKGYTAVVQQLLQAPGINVNLQTQEGFTALMLAAKNGHASVVEGLLQRPGINVNAQNRNGATALLVAAHAGHTAIVQRLLQVPGINVNARTRNGRTALRVTRQSNNPNKEAIIKLLVDHEAIE